MRDPVFYRWHGLIDSIFQSHKKLLNPYAKEELEFQHLKVVKIEVRTDQVQEPNVLNTRWGKETVNLSKGLDFTRNKDIEVT
jgi:tyrosinase